MTALVMVAVVILSNLIHFITGGSIFGVRSSDGATICFGGSSLAYHQHYQHPQN